MVANTHETQEEPLEIEIIGGDPIETPKFDEKEVIARPSIVDSLELDRAQINEDSYYEGMDKFPDGLYKFEGTFPPIGLGEDLGELVPIEIRTLGEDESATDPMVGEKMKPGTKIADVGGNRMNINTLKYLLTSDLPEENPRVDFTIDEKGL